MVIISQKRIRGTADITTHGVCHLLKLYNLTLNIYCRVSYTKGNNLYRKTNPSGPLIYAQKISERKREFFTPRCRWCTCRVKKVTDPTGFRSATALHYCKSEVFKNWNGFLQLACYEPTKWWAPEIVYRYQLHDFLQQIVKNLL